MPSGVTVDSVGGVSCATVCGPAMWLDACCDNGISMAFTAFLAALSPTAPRFHGRAPSKNKPGGAQRKYLEELAVARATTSDNPSAELDRLRELQKQTGAAFIPLTGRAKPGAAVRDPLAGRWRCTRI